MSRDREGTGSREARAGAGWLGLGPVNYALFAAAAVSVVVGYVLLDRGSVTAAPMLLVLGYAILFPAGLLVGYGGLADDEGG